MSQLPADKICSEPPMHHEPERMLFCGYVAKLLSAAFMPADCKRSNHYLMITGKVSKKLTSFLFIGGDETWQI